DSSILDGIGSLTQGGGNAGNVIVTAGRLSISNDGMISSLTLGAGNSGDVSVSASEMLLINGPSGISRLNTGILADSQSNNSGNAGNVAVSVGTLSIAGSNAQISSSTFGPGKGGDISVTVAGTLSIDGKSADPQSVTGIVADAEQSTGSVGNVTIGATTLSIVNNGKISSSTFASGNAGSVTATVSDQLTIDASNADVETGATGIFSISGGSGSAGS